MMRLVKMLEFRHFCDIVDYAFTASCEFYRIMGGFFTTSGVWLPHYPSRTIGKSCSPPPHTGTVSIIGSFVSNPNHSTGRLIVRFTH